MSVLTDVLHSIADHLGASYLHDKINQLDTDKVPQQPVDKGSEDSNAEQ